ncbi:hypothetical protein ABK046_47755, partial [Streptomyces caeruleatus]
SNSTDIKDMIKVREYLNIVRDRMIPALEQVSIPGYLIPTTRVVLAEIEHYLSLMPPMRG